MADSNEAATPAGEKDMDLQTAQVEDTPGKSSEGNIVDKPMNDDKNGSEDNKDLAKPIEGSETKSNGYENSRSEDSVKEAESECIDTTSSEHNDSVNNSTPDKPSSSVNTKEASNPMETESTDNAIDVEQSDNHQIKPDSKDSIAEGFQEPHSSGVGDSVPETSDKNADDEKKAESPSQDSSGDASASSKADAESPSLVSSGDASASSKADAAPSSKDDTPNAPGDASSSTVEDTSRSTDGKKDAQTEDKAKPSSTSPVAVTSNETNPDSDNANGDVTSHSNKPTSTSGSQPGSASTSPKTKNSSDGKAEDQSSKHEDGDVVILDEKNQSKKSAPVKQEPADNESKDSQSKKGPRECIVCRQVGKCKYNIVRNGCTKHLCDDLCYRTFKQEPAKYLRSDNKTSNKGSPVAATTDEKGKVCAACNSLITDRSVMASDLVNGEVKDFCGEACRSKYASQKDNDDEVEIVGTSIVGSSSKGKQAVCCVCMKQAIIKHDVNVNNQQFKICSNACFNTFSKQRGLGCELCEQCFKPCQKTNAKTQCIQFEGKLVHFCSTICLNVFKTTKQKIVTCSWCHAKKSNFDMVERIDGNSKCQMFCSLNCLSLYRVQLQATSQNNVSCDQCHKPSPAQYHLTMSDASVRNFCSYECVVQFQKQFMPPSNNANLSTNEIHQNIAAQAKPPSVPLSQAKAPPVQPTRQSSRQAAKATQKPTSSVPNIPVISNVVSLAPSTVQGRSLSSQTVTTAGTSLLNQQVKVYNAAPSQVVIEQPPPVSMKNKGVLCRPNYLTKATSCRPLTMKASTQTDEDLSKPQGLLPVPIPIYVPVPIKMYHHPVPYPILIPIPIPVPVFIPTTKKSANGILKHIKELQEKIPEDPFEAELLQMAEAVASAEKAQESSDSEDDAGAEAASPLRDDTLDSAGGGNSNPGLGEDIVQAAFRLSGFDQPVLDLEDALEPSCIDPEAPGTRVENNNTENEEPLKPTTRGGKKRGRGRGRGRPATKKRKMVEEEEQPAADSPMEPPPPLPSDADFALKFTYGVNAWTHWIIQKNIELEQSSSNKSGPKKRYKTSLLACSAEELNKSLCQFVKEVRKPNGEEYAADSIFYLCLGIQQYLYENGRIDNIFTDWYFENFTECLDEILAKYEPKLNTYGLMVCRIEEEHLWECKQLGAHSPHVLLMTLIYFNTKYFMMRTPEEHLRLSFSHVVKHWKKSPIGAQGAGRSVYLKYYAPNQTVDNRKKKEDPVSFEQMEDPDNPLRCPVKLYEFYLSKCPESIRNRSDVFYLVPERSCVPDSPVWYSTQNLTKDTMTHLLNRVKVVREIQESFLLHPNPVPPSS